VSRAIPIAAALAVFVVGCRGEVSTDPPITPLRNMHFQQRYNSQAESPFFADHRTMRNPPEGTVSRFPGGANVQYVGFSVGHDEEFLDDALTLGHEADSPAYVMTIPERATQAAGGAEAMVRRGQQRYGIYCTPCHGGVGDGRGLVYLRSLGPDGPRYQYPQPANLHDERIRHIPDGQLFATISNGVRNMPGYSAQIPVSDRWAIVSYVRALQLSQINNGATP
jgi:mono/diheme cytochrome c family protein